MPDEESMPGEESMPEVVEQSPWTVIHQSKKERTMAMDLAGRQLLIRVSSECGEALVIANDCELNGSTIRWRR